MDPPHEQLLLGPQLPSIGQVLRSLKRQENGLFNCVASTLDDARFVEQICRLYPGLNAYANLRCGVWYLQRPTHTCVFKSTDGHSGNWSFSLTRLNLAVAEDAAARGGCVVVDATRRGKSFPDALTKTVPIWAAVVNRAVARLRARQAAAGSSGGGSSSSTAGGGGGKDGGGALASSEAAEQHSWDGDVHLPPWISGNEKHQIELRLEGWVDQLLEVGADLSTLARTLRKPLRCVWLSQESRIWTDQVADTSCYDFTPLVLVSASLPNARGRRQLTLDAGGGQAPLTVAYYYVPGAGDDEESWAHGLTPTLMWRHRRELLAAGPEGIEAWVRELLRRTAAEGTAPGGGQQQRQGTDPGQMVAAAGVKQKHLAARRVATDAHHLAPQGCRAAAGAAGAAGSHGDAPAAAGSGNSPPGAQVHFIGATGLALGAVAAGAPPGVWSRVDAVLNVGLWEHSGMAGEGRTGQPAAQAAAGQPTAQAAAGQPAAQAAGSAREARQAGAQPGLAAERAGGAAERPLPHHQPGTPAESPSSSSIGQATAEDAAGGQPSGPAPLRYLWLPVPHSKFERQALHAALPAAVEFVSGHLQAGRRVLIHCDDGLDTSVCTAVAVLVACFQLPEPQAAGPATAQPGPACAGPDGAAGAAGTAGREEGQRPSPQLVQPFKTDPSTHVPMPAASELFSKLTVRRYLSALSSYYPQARPSQGMLKQVYNMFVPGGGFGSR